VNTIGQTDACFGSNHAVLIGGFNGERQNLNLLASEELLQRADTFKIIQLSWSRKHFTNFKTLVPKTSPLISSPSNFGIED
jgi:hypothetical protein